MKNLKYMLILAALWVLCPSGLYAQTPAQHSATLTWTASVSPAPITYNVWRATTSGGEDSATTGTMLNPVGLTGTTYTDTTVVAGTTYYYVVRAVNSAGIASPDSNEVMGVIVSVPTTPPAPPTQLKITIN